MNKNSKGFLRNAIIISLATVFLIIFMGEWGAAQVIIVLLMALLSAGQWALFLYMKKQ